MRYPQDEQLESSSRHLLNVCALRDELCFPDTMTNEANVWTLFSYLWVRRTLECTPTTLRHLCFPVCSAALTISRVMDDQKRKS